MTSSREERREILGYLTELRKAMVDAHTHKETIGWAIAAFYVVGTVQGYGSLFVKAVTLQSKVAVAVAYILFSLVLLAYARRMFNLRGYYIHMSGAVEILMTECLAGHLDHLTDAQLSRPARASAEATNVGSPGGPGNFIREVASRISQRVLAVRQFFFPPRIPVNLFEDLYPAFVLEQAREQARERATRLGRHSEPDKPEITGERRVYDFPYVLMLLVGSLTVIGIFVRP